MEIITKYNIGQKVWIILKNDNHKELEVFTDTIIEIVIGKDNKAFYFCDSLGDDIAEENIVLYEDTQLLLKKIIELEKEL